MSFKCPVTEVEWTAYPVPSALYSAVADVLINYHMQIRKGGASEPTI